MGFAPLIPIIAGGVSGAASIIGGISQQNSDNAAARQYQQNAKNAMTAADQQEAQRRADLVSTISSVNAIRGARGEDATSPTGMAIAQNLTAKAQMGIDTERLNYAQQASADQVQAGIMRNQGRIALFSGVAKGVFGNGQPGSMSLFSAFNDANNYYGWGLG